LIERTCTKQLASDFMSKRKALKKQKFREDLLSKRFNIHLSYLALNPNSKQAVLKSPLVADKLR